MPDRIVIPKRCLEIVSNRIGLLCLDSPGISVGTFHKKVCRGIMLFDLSILPVWASINRSLLTLIIRDNVRPKKIKTFSIHKVTTEWPRLFNICCPGYDPVPAAEFTIEPGTQQVIVDITSLTEDWQKDPQRNYGMLIKSCNEHINNTGICIYSPKDCNIQLWPALNIAYSDIKVIVEPEFIKYTENNLVTRADYQFSKEREMGTALMSSFFVLNKGSNSALVQLQVSADNISFIDDGREARVAPGEQVILVAQYFGEFARVAYRSANPALSTTLDIIYIAKLT